MNHDNMDLPDSHVRTIAHTFSQAELLHLATRPIILAPAPGPGRGYNLTGGYYIKDTLAGGYHLTGEATQPTALLTLTGNPAVGDAMNVAGTDYTFVAPVDFNAANLIPVGLSVAATITNILAAVTGTDGFNADIAYLFVSAHTLSTITFTWNAPGVTGNVQPSTYTNSGIGTNHFSAATFTGGLDGPQPFLTVNAAPSPGDQGAITIGGQPRTADLANGGREKFNGFGSAVAVVFENQPIRADLTDGNNSAQIGTNLNGGDPLSRVYVEVYYTIVPTNIPT